MRAPDELDDVDWASCAGEAVPELIRMLFEDPAGFDGDRFHELQSHIYNSGGVYPATLPAVPFLCYAAVNAEFFPDIPLHLLSLLTDLPAGAREPETAVRDAVAAEAVELLPCLDFADPELRRLALRVFGGSASSLGADRPRVAAALAEVFENELDRDVAADALTALELLEDPAVFADRIEQALGENDPVIRLTGLLCALETGYVPQGAETAGLVDEAGRLAAKYSEGRSESFPLLGTRHERAQRAFRALQAGAGTRHNRESA